MVQIALCDNDKYQREITQSLLKRYNFTRRMRLDVCTYWSAEALLEDMKEGREFDVYLLEILLPGMDGLALAEKIRNWEKDVPIIFITRSSSPEHAYSAFRLWAKQCLMKPADEGLLFNALDEINGVYMSEKAIFAPYRDSNVR